MTDDCAICGDEPGSMLCSGCYKLFRAKLRRPGTRISPIYACLLWAARRARRIAKERRL